MSHAFDGNAFDLNAFDVGAEVGTVLGGGIAWPHPQLSERHWSAPKSSRLPLPKTQPKPEPVTATCESIQAAAETIAYGNQSIAAIYSASLGRQRSRGNGNLMLSFAAESRQSKPTASATGDMVDVEMEIIAAIMAVA